MLELEMSFVLVKPSVLLGAASLLTVVLKDLTVAIIMLSEPIFSNKDTATPPHTFEDFLLMLTLTFALSPCQFFDFFITFRLF
jgi:hypothetical protein